MKEYRHERQSLVIGIQLRVLFVGLFLFPDLFSYFRAPGDMERDSAPYEVLSDSWAVRKCFARYNSVVFNHTNYRL